MLEIIPEYKLAQLFKKLPFRLNKNIYHGYLINIDPTKLNKLIKTTQKA